ncbi:MULTISPECIES: hypothetical protein [Bacillus]|jgi:hypothetical protein|uniref:hypothetical protein n=1 Tax=Bacillus TaxID=1386 RepID=UPI0005EAFBE6|nr:MULTISPECIES: hypothetical protein [Bacillus]ASZ03859.1 hypothetical protein CJP14_08275 [Bacillus velezensis]KJR69206.1 hypothetical protein BAGR45_10090 [Bacillus velezensis]MCB5334912.1 hypothetical protein [Bacillus amyloliquefaciens]MCC5597057.1 hypothetical protein [Bacillus velezensis]MVZ95541.1 hypothetical protein [Bacillus velezensis]
MKISIKTRLNPTDQYKVDDFINAFKNLPPEIRIQLSMDNGNSWLLEQVSVKTERILLDCLQEEIKNIDNHPLYSHATSLGQTVFHNTHEIVDVVKEYVKKNG